MIKMIKKIFKSLREYKKYTILTPVFVFIEVLLEVLIPLLMAKLIDDGIEGQNIEVVYRMGLFLLVASVCSLIGGMLAGIFVSKASTGFSKNLREDLFNKVQNFSFYNIDKFSTSSLITRLTTDVQNIEFAFQMIVRTAARAPLMLVNSIGFSYFINPKLCLVFLIVVPILGVSLILIAKKVHPIMEKTFKTYDELNNVVEENVRNIRVVKSFTLEDEEESKFKKVSKKIYSGFVKGETIIALNSPIMQFCMYSCIILISWFGAHIIVESNMTELTTGELMTLFSYTNQILGSLMMLSFVFVIAIISRASLERIVEVLDEIPDIKNPKEPVMEVRDGSIEFNNVSFSYVKDKEKEVLRNIKVNIKSGETIGIIGEVGCGKSSFVNLIPRLYDVTEGVLKVGGVDVKDYDLKVLRDNVAVVLQKNVLFSGTIEENIKWGDEKATHEEVVKVCKAAQADGFINKKPDKYDTFLEEGGVNVSGGQKQRLCIARALLKKPKILILDDSTSAVDTKTDSLILKAFKEDVPDVTKIIIAQRISSVKDADRIIVLDGGKINGIGSHEELIKSNKIYKEVYDSQLEGSDK